MRLLCELQNYKRTWNCLWTWAGIVGSWGSRRFEVRRFSEDVMRLRVKCHRTGAKLRVHIAHNGVFVRRILVDHAQKPFPDRRKDQPRARIESVAVGISADGR